MQLGVIADDFTGATDIASFLVRNGMPTVQLNGVPTRDLPLTSEAVVISLKTRSCPAEMAVSQSLAALRWLQAQGCQQFYFKYCSTFDSTAQGNIGPVLDALLAELGETRTVISPALPLNGRTVYQGYLFVGEQLLNESGMRHHPVTPMEDAHLGRLIERQGRGKAALIAWPIVARGPEAVAAALAAVNDPAVRYVVLDALSEQDLLTQGVALREMKLVSGGSGLAIGLARDWAQRHGARGESAQAGMPLAGPAVVLSGSCSVMTNSQVAAYRQQAPARAVEPSKGRSDDVMVDNIPPEELEIELSGRQIEQLDAIDNTVYQTILTFLNKTEDEFPWDMHYIGEVADAIEGTLLDLGQRVHRPAIITEKDGTVHLEEYQEPVLQTPKKNKKKEKPAYER